MRFIPVLACLLVLCLGAGAGAGEGAGEGFDVELAWASGPPEAYAGLGIEVPYTGWAGKGLEIPFGPGASLRMRDVVRTSGPAFLLDTDFDGSFTDERPLDWQCDLPDLSRFVNPGSGTPKLPVLHKQATAVVHPPWAAEQGLDHGVRVHLVTSISGVDKTLHVVALLHRKGLATLGCRVRMVVVYDGNGDLRFDDETGDLLCIDLDGDRSITRSDPNPERVLPGVPFLARETAWSAKAAGVFAERVVFLRQEAAAPPVRRWCREEVPPAGEKHEGASRPLDEIKAEYREKKGALRRGRTAPVTLCSLVHEAGRLGTDEAFAFLWRVYKAHDSEVLRESVLSAMGDVRYRAHAATLLKVGKRLKGRRLMLSLLHALHRMDAPGRDKLMLDVAKRATEDGVFRLAVRYAAFTGTERARQGLVKLTAGSARHPERAYEAYVAATRYFDDPPPVALIEKAVRSGRGKLRALALSDAKDLPYPRARDLALECLSDARQMRALRPPVTDILARTADKRSVGAVLELVGDLKARERDRLARLLEPVRDPAATELLLAALGNASPTVRAVAADAAAGLEHADLDGLLAARIGREEDPVVRLALLRAVGRREAKAAVPALLRLMEGDETDEDVRSLGIEVLMAVGLEREDVQRALLEAARSEGAWETRLLIADGAARNRIPFALDLLLVGLSDAQWQVRLVAAQGLARLKRKEAILPLIERVAVEERGRVKNAVVRSLYLLTGKNFYDVVEVWRRWWTSYGEAFVVPASVPDLPEADPGKVYGTFYGVPVESDHLLFVLDQSGSMDVVADSTGQSGTAFERAVGETLAVVKKLPDGSAVNVILFESDIHPWRDGLVVLDEASRKALHSFLRGKEPTGATNLYDGLARAVRTADVDTVYLLSDGQPSAGRITDEDDIVHAIKELNFTARVVIHCVALGYDSPLLKELAALTGGTYVVR